MSLVQFFRILYARRWILLTSLFSCLFVGIVMAQTLPKRYVAHARVMLDIVKPDPVTGQVIGTQFLRAYTRTQIELIKDQQTAQQVVDTLGWVNNPEIVRQYEARDPSNTDDIRTWLANRVIAGTEAELIEASNILQISYTSANPEIARRIVSLIRDAYVNASLTYRRETAGRTADWFRDQTEQAQALVRAAEAERAQFAKSNGVVLQADNTDLESSRLSALSSQTAVEVVQPSGSASAPAATSPSQTQLELVTQQLEQAGSILGPRHPTYQSLERQREALASVVARERAAMGASRTASAPARRSVDAEYERQKTKVVAQSETIDMINRMTRDIELKRTQLAKIAERASDLRLQANVGETGLSPLGNAVAPSRPEFPNVPLIIAASLGFGAGLGICLSLLIELLGRRVRSQEDLEHASEAPVFAEISATRKKQAAPYRKLIRYLSDRARRTRPVAVGAE